MIASFSTNTIEEVISFINKTLPNCIRATHGDTEKVLGLPYRYTVPCATELFTDMYYWDTFFTNEGLCYEGYVDLALDNTNNLLSLLDRLGYVPNSNLRVYANRSQPPYLAMMVDRVFSLTLDTVWLKSATGLLETEYEFWMKKRDTGMGLNRHFHQATREELLEFFENELKKRLDLPPMNEEDALITASHHLAEAESGWDFNPRFSMRCADYAPIDLNSNLYVYETLFAKFSKILGTKDQQIWKTRAEKRKELLFLCNLDKESHLFYDYDFVNKKQSDVFSSAALHALWAGIAGPDEARAFRNNLCLIESDYGVSSCENSPRNQRYQWDFPNGWAPHFYMGVEGLSRYGFDVDARRIARKWVYLVCSNFEKTGNLWEKYNVTDGSLNVNNEYQMPSMIGWTAGVFLHCVKKFDLLNSQSP